MQVLETCAGKGCNKLGTIPLTLRYLNLSGYFCDECADSLVKDGLAVEAAK